MNSYVDLLRTPGVARIIAAQLTARFPSGMISLGFLLHMERIFDSYAAAGIVLAATSVGQAISGPLTSRLMGVLGMRRVLVATIAVCARRPHRHRAARSCRSGATSILGAVTGLSYPPVQPAVRTIYPKMVNGRQLTPLFSLDASAQEIIWIAGPVVVTFVGTQVSTVAGVLLSVVFLVGGGAWFVLSPEVGRVRIPRSKRRVRRRAGPAAGADRHDRRLPGRRIVRRDRGRRRRHLRRGQRDLGDDPGLVSGTTLQCAVRQLSTTGSVCHDSCVTLDDARAAHSRAPCAPRSA